jgi:hypothetical protein
MGRRQGLSARGLALGAVAVGATPAWLDLFRNPYLTDGAAMGGITALWAAWVLDLWPLALVLMAWTPWIRETVAVAPLWWAWSRRWGKAAVGLLAVGLSLFAVHHAVRAAPSPGLCALVAENLRQKPAYKIVGDVFGSYQAVWLMAFCGTAVASNRRRSSTLPGLWLMLMTALASSLVAQNTVRMFAFAVPFVALLVAEFFEDLLFASPLAAYGLGAVSLAGWFFREPTLLLGDALASHKRLQYLVGGPLLVATVLVWLRRTRAVDKIRSFSSYQQSSASNGPARSSSWK